MKPILLVMAGPNGSGKSTISARFTPIGDYVNADVIEKELGISTRDAAILAEETREELLRQGKDFTFETVLSTPRNLDLMRRARAQDYTVLCVYVLTKDVSINLARVRQRVEKGGHGVPEEKIKERYARAMKLIPSLIKVCDELYIYDNSADRSCGVPQRIVSCRNGKPTLFPSKQWSRAMLKKLVSGTYMSP